MRRGWIVVLISLLGCGQQPKGEISASDSSLKPTAKSRSYLSHFPEVLEMLNRSNPTPLGNSWRLIQTSDSSCKIQWTANNLKRETDSQFDFYSARHFHLVWENRDFIALQAGRGSDAWFGVYLPLNSGPKEISLENPLAFDSHSNLVAAEHLGDTIIKIVNLKTKAEQPIIETKNKCGSGFNHYCIDSISISKNRVYYRWITPNKIDNKNFVQKKVRVQI